MVKNNRHEVFMLLYKDFYIHFENNSAIFRQVKLSEKKQSITYVITWQKYYIIHSLNTDYQLELEKCL